MGIQVFNEDELVAEIDVQGTVVSVKNYSTDESLLPFGFRDTVTYEEFLQYIEDRAFPEDKEECREVFSEYGFKLNPLNICRLTYGQQYRDRIWLLFTDSFKVSYEDIKLW